MVGLNAFLSPKRSVYHAEEENLSALRRPDSTTFSVKNPFIQQGGRFPPPSCSFEHSTPKYHG